VNLTEWAHAQGIDVTTAYRSYREGAARLGAEGWPADPGVPRYGLYARVSCHGLPVVRVETEVGSGVDGARARARRLLADRRSPWSWWSTATGWGG
jgi:putative resolvase